jgi:hypothetical protein
VQNVAHVPYATLRTSTVFVEFCLKKGKKINLFCTIEMFTVDADYDRSLKVPTHRQRNARVDGRRVAAVAVKWATVLQTLSACL